MMAIAACRRAFARSGAPPVRAVPAPVPAWSLREHLRPHLPRLGFAAVVMAARAGVLVLAPWPLKYIIDSVILGKRLPHWAVDLLPDPGTQWFALLNVLTGLTLALGLADGLLDYAGNRLFLNAGQRVVFDIRRQMFGHMLRLSPAFHRSRRAGELMSRLSEDVQRLQEFVSGIGTGLLPHTMTILGMLTVMLLLDWRYALLVGAIAPLLAFISQRWTGLLRANLRRVRTHDGELWGVAQEMLGAVQLVQTFGREAHEDHRFAAKANDSLQASLRSSATQAQFAPLVNLVITIGSCAATWYGAVQVLHGSLTAGELLVFLAYLRGMVTPARQLAKGAPVMGRTAIALERIRELFAEIPPVRDRPGVIAPAACEGWLVFHGVGFGHTPGAATLRDVSFRLEPGRTVALVGSTGSGKSSLAALAARFADPETGQVLLDGHDLRDLPVDFVRRNVALLSQEPVLLRGTVWENIACARPGASRADAIRAATALGVDQIIAELPGGFDQHVAERGATLSGGQRQCIALARAALADAPVVILDAPTSSLDAATEKRILDALGQLTTARACLMIAHRLDTICGADLILVLQRGRVVQSGTHRQLLAREGLYAALWATQHPQDPPSPLAGLAMDQPVAG